MQTSEKMPKKPEDRKPYPQRARDRIRASKILTRLQKHALGEAEMKGTEIRAAEILLKKVLPDMSFVESDNTHKGHVKVDEDSIAEARAKLEPLRLVK